MVGMVALAFASPALQTPFAHPLVRKLADISYGVVHAHTTYGRIGVKAWVYRGEQLGERPGSARTEPRAPRRGAAGECQGVAAATADREHHHPAPPQRRAAGHA